MRPPLVLLVLLLASACSRGGREPQPPPGPCPCACPAGTPAAPGVASGAPLAPGPSDVTGLLSDASRKMHHGDGLGCLQDLDRLLQSDARYTEQQTMLRAQCEMLSGRCQEGKQRVDAWAGYQLNMPAEQRLSLSEGLASMYCRGGNMTERDRLLAAQHQLMQGAALRQSSSAECQTAYQTVRSLMSKVPPRNADDTLVASIPRTLFHTAANCFARAGDCAGARRTFDESYPQDSLANVKDPKLRQSILDSAFKSTVPRCAP